VNLMQLAEAGDTDGVLRELGGLTPAQRTACAEDLAAAPERHTNGQREAQRVAELGCQVSPEAAADWLLRNRPQPPSYRRHLSYDRLVEVTSLYPAGWRAELVERLAAAAPDWPVWWFPLAEHIVRDTGGVPPTTDTFIAVWLDKRRYPDELPAGVRSGVPGDTFLERLRNDDFTPRLLPLALTRPGVPLDLSGFHLPRKSVGLPRLMEITPVGVFISLCNEGVADRGALIRRILTDLLSARPDLEDAANVLTALALTPAEHASVTEERIRLVEELLGHARGSFMGGETGAAIVLLRALAPTAAESARFAEKHLALLELDWYLPSAGAAIGYAQEALLGADRAGLLSAESFTDVSERVLKHPALGLRDYRAPGFVSRLTAGKAIDRDALIRRFFADLLSGTPSPEDATHVLTALALTPAEHASVTEDRIRLVEPLLADLLQADERKRVAASLAYLSALAPTAPENARFTREYVALLDRSSPVAGHAQEVLLGLDEAGLLDHETFTEVCQRVLLRPEKKLVRAQLAGLDHAAGRDPGRAARLVADAATAFQHQDPAVQERALDVIARHLGAAGDSARPGLRAAAEWLSPAFSARCAELFGAAADAARSDPGDAVAEVLPALPEPRPVPGPAATAVEVAQEVAAVIAGDQDVAAFERALDGLVRHARTDRDALAKALKPATRRKPAEDTDGRPADIYDVALAVRGERPRDFAIDGPASRSRYFSRPGAMLAARLSEAIGLIESGAQPFLLAVPTLGTGALDADVLVERLAELERLAVEAAPVDLAQALLRVIPSADARVLHAAGALRSAAGQRLARWLRDGGLPHQDSEPPDWYQSQVPGSWEPARPGIALAPWFPPVAAALVGPDRLGRMIMEPPAPFWVAQLPRHRDEMAARDYAEPIVSNGRRRTRVLPFVAEAGGPAGYAVHLAVARGLANGPHGDDATVDALLVLAARGHLDTGLLGRQLETLLRGGWIQANRVAAALRAAAETGAYGTVWAVIEAALPGLLRDTPLKEAAVFLALAVECVARCGATGEIAEVVALAKRGGSSQAAKNARLLRDALR
jgi:Trp operon repressor